MSRDPRQKPRRITLEDALPLLATEPPEHVLYLADPWPWTTGTLVALTSARPIWAAAAVPVSDLRGITERNPDLAIREINRRLDPGPRPPRR
jgi:hypothetical protein